MPTVTVSRRYLFHHPARHHRWRNGDISTSHHLIYNNRSIDHCSPSSIAGLILRIEAVVIDDSSIHLVTTLIEYFSPVAAFKTMATVTETVTLPYMQAPETSAELDWADLATLDLSKFNQPGGKQELAATLARALEEIGRSNSRQS